MTGVLEEIAGTGKGVIEAMKSQPLMLAMGVMNVGLLLFLFWYTSRITARTELTVANLFSAQDKLFNQWGVIVKDTSDLAEKSLHCLSVEDTLKLLAAPRLQGPLKLDSPVPWIEAVPIKHR